MISPHEVLQLWESRRRAAGPHLARMLEVSSCYNGDLMVPLPELDENERPAVANLLMQGVDQLGMRASSTLPDVDFVPLTQRDADLARARDQRRAVLGWFDMNGLAKKEARRARYLVAYGMGPVMVKPVAAGYSQRTMPHWHMLNPLATYPAPSSDRDCIEPENVIVHRHIAYGWLRERYPLQASRLYKGPSDRNGTHPMDLKFDLLEYNDAEETVLVVAGAIPPSRGYADPQDGVTPVEMLERIPNRAGMCLAVCPGRVTLDRLMGHFDSIIGMFMAQAKLTAYENIAVRQSIFPELWVMSHPNAPTAARIVRVADGKQGVIGLVENGVIQPITTQPNQMTNMAIDRLERAARVSGSIPADWGGESANNIRTAKRGQEIMASASDPTLGEIQTVLAEAKEAEIVRGIAVEKGWFGRKTISFNQPRNGKVVGDTFVPNDLFTTDYCHVKFSMPGVDAAGIPIELGQRTQTGMLSVDTARRIDPMVEDPEHEADQVELEGMRSAMLRGLEAQAQGGQLDPHEVALIADRKRAHPGASLEECVLWAHEEMQKQQAALAEAEPGSPETQPGMGAGGPAGLPGPAPGNQGPPPLAQLLAGLRVPAQQGGAERQLAGAGGGTAPGLAAAGR